MNDAAPGPEEKELLLREDRRLLGRLLGDVIAEQVGPRTRERIETIRQTAVRFRRSLPDPALAGDAQGAKAELEAQLDALPIDETLHVVRAFSYFSFLLNIAEDAHQHRRRQAHASAATSPSICSVSPSTRRESRSFDTPGRSARMAARIQEPGAGRPVSTAPSSRSALLP